MGIVITPDAVGTEWKVEYYRIRIRLGIASGHDSLLPCSTTGFMSGLRRTCSRLLLGVCLSTNQVRKRCTLLRMAQIRPTAARGTREARRRDTQQLSETDKLDQIGSNCFGTRKPRHSAAVGSEAVPYPLPIRRPLILPQRLPSHKSDRAHNLITSSSCL